MTVATESDPYFAFPKLYGAPAYARPPRVVPESERPFDPDDLPIAAEMTDEERAVASRLESSATYQLVPQPSTSSADGASSGLGGHGNGASRSRFTLRGLTGRRDPAAK